MGKGLDMAEKRKLKIANKHTKCPTSKKNCGFFSNKKIYKEMF